MNQGQLRTLAAKKDYLSLSRNGGEIESITVLKERGRVTYRAGPGAKGKKQGGEPPRASNKKQADPKKKMGNQPKK